MGRNTAIEWCDSTVNPTSGCDGCELWNCETGGTCYAAKIHNRFAGRNPGYPGRFEEVRCHPGRMLQAAHWPDLTGKRRSGKPWLDGRPRHIFIGDMSDNFSRSVPLQYLLDEVIANVISEAGQRHRWLWLTKRPKRMLEFSMQLSEWNIAWPDNLMAMTSVTDRITANGRVPPLLDVHCLPHGLSIEPLLGRVGPWQEWFRFIDRIDWVIIGGESGPAARACDLDSMALIVQRCRASHVPVFVKQVGACPTYFCETDFKRWPLPAGDAQGRNPAWWPADLRVREMPAWVIGELESTG